MNALTRATFEVLVVAFWGQDGETRVRCAISKEAYHERRRIRLRTTATLWTSSTGQGDGADLAPNKADVSIAH